MPIYLKEEEVRSLLEHDPHLTGAVETLESAFKDYANDRVITPGQERVRLVAPKGANRRPYDRDMRILPAMVPSIDSAGVRIGCTSMAGKGSTSYTLLMDYERLAPLAIIEDHFLHAVRSGTPTGIAVKHLANADASRLAVLGSGRIAKIQLAVSLGQRSIQSVRVYSPTRAHREAFAAEGSTRFGVPMTAVDSPEEAVSSADIVVSATDSHNEPVIDGNWLPPGCLVASVTPGEMDRTTALRSRVIVTSRNRVATDYTPQEPLDSLVKSGELNVDELPLLGDVLLGRTAGRECRDQIVFLFSPGIGLCDVAVARWVYDLAVRHHAGITL